MVGRRCCAAPIFGLRSTAALPEAGVAEMLSRSRKVRSQVPNKINFVTARDDGQKANSLPGCTHLGTARTLIPQKFVRHVTGGIDQFDGGLDIIVIPADSLRS